MSKLEEAERLLAEMTSSEKAQLLQWVVRDLGEAFPGIEMDPTVSGGEPCIVRTRIPVWVLEQARRLGTSEADLLRSYPGLRAEDLANAWGYVRAHREEINKQIEENEAAQTLARLYANENFPLPTVEVLRERGHDVLTSHDAGRANRKIPDEDVLNYATAEGRALLTLNRRHFVKLHQARPVHSGIIVCVVDSDFRAQAMRVWERRHLLSTDWGALAFD